MLWYGESQNIYGLCLIVDISGSSVFVQLLNAYCKELINYAWKLLSQHEVYCLYSKKNREKGLSVASTSGERDGWSVLLFALFRSGANDYPNSHNVYIPTSKFKLSIILKDVQEAISIF